MGVMPTNLLEYKYMAVITLVRWSCHLFNFDSFKDI